MAQRISAAAWPGILCLCVFIGALSATSLQAKTLVYCLEADTATLSPALAVSRTDEVASAFQMYNTLMAQKPGTTRIVPALAEAWKASSDGRTYTFKLRRGVKFHTNYGFTPKRDLNADDVIFSFDRQWRSDHPYHSISGGSYTYFDLFDLDQLIESIEKIDDYTVKFRLSEPNALFAIYTAIPSLSIYSAEYGRELQKTGELDNLDLEPIGTGPFKLVQHRKDSLIRYAAHPSYWNGQPIIDELVFVVVPDPSVRYQKLKAGECHVMAYPNPAEIGLMQADPDIRVLETVGLDFGFLALNTEKRPFDDRRVRQAINMAIDKDAIIDIIFRGISGVRAKTPIPPTLWSYNHEIEAYPYDPEEAKRLLSEAGYTDGFSATLWAMPVQRPYNPNARRMAELIHADLAKVGIEMEIVSYDWAEYISRGRAGKHDTYLIGWIADFGDPDNFLRSMWSCAAVKQGINFSRFCHPRLDELLTKAKKTSDRSLRTNYYREAQEIFHNEALAVPIAHSVLFTPIRKEVKGFKQSPIGIMNFNGVDLQEMRN